MTTRVVYEGLLNAYETLEQEALDATDSEFYFDKCAEIRPALLEAAEACGATWPKRCVRCGGATTHWRNDDDTLPRIEHSYEADGFKQAFSYEVDCETCEQIAETITAFFAWVWHEQLAAEHELYLRTLTCAHGKHTHVEHCADCAVQVYAYIGGMMRRPVL